MSQATQLQMSLLPGARELLELHARELPQRDDLCGAFCTSLALRAAGLEVREGEPVDQDAVALAAGTVVSRSGDPDALPQGEPGRRDYRLALPFIDDEKQSGTPAGGLLEAVEQLSDGRQVAIPFTGPWTASTLGGLFDLAASLERPVTLVANIATRHLWGSHAGLGELLSYLLDGERPGPPPDWDVGHFVCVIGRVQGPRGSLYAVADTYPSLGTAGVHMQPQERLAAALERRDMPEGGMFAVVSAEDAAPMRSGAAALGLLEGIWDNGTATQATQR
jgi:Family of unknown function (DUF6885)